MSFLVPPRRHDAEWMDHAGNSKDDLENALADIALVNRWLGGARALERAVVPFVRETAPGERLRILDIGTGGADLPRGVVALGRRLGRRVEVAAVELDPTTASIAARSAGPEGGVSVVRADAFALPFRDASFDLVTASMFLHHFGEADAARLVAGFRRFARRAVIVNDLHRHFLPWAFIAGASRLTGRHPMFVHDAPLSVLRGFTRDELLRIARAAGAPSARVESRWPYRLLMTLPGGRS